MSYLYVELDANGVVFSKSNRSIPSDSVDPNVIEIGPEQYDDTSILGKKYNRKTGEFEVA